MSIVARWSSFNDDPHLSVFVYWRCSVGSYAKIMEVLEKVQI
jgi:hypothetical protein